MTGDVVEKRAPEQPALWDLHCLLCGSLTGQIVDSTFVHDPSCTLPVRRVGGQLRCCRCGGSLLREPGAERQTAAVTLEQARSYNHGKYRVR